MTRIWKQNNNRTKRNDADIQKEKRWPGHKNINNTTERDDPDMKKKSERDDPETKI